MKILGSALPLVLITALCASVAACANAPSGYSSQEPQSPPAPTNPQAHGGGAQPRLSIQAGEGEKLNLPWFVRDVQDWVNEGGATFDLERPPENP